MTDILLINPPWSRFFGVQGHYVPLGLCYVAGMLEKNGYDVKIYNADISNSVGLSNIKGEIEGYQKYLETVNDLNDPIWKEVRQTIKNEKPDIIGLSVMTSKYTASINVAKIAKDISSNIKVIFGGVHPTISPEEVLNNNAVDYVIRGEGEHSMLELVNALTSSSQANIKNINGISFKDSAIHHNPHRDLVENIDEIPFPARHLIMNKDTISPHHFGRIFASRGCPFQCIYCSSYHIWGKNVRYRSPENIVKEIAHVKNKYNAKLFIFDDDTFTINRKWVEEICELLISKRLNIIWRCETRPKLVNDSLVKKMKLAGCFSISIGVESGNDGILKKIKKGTTVEEIEEATRIIKKNGLLTDMFFMIGFPWESEKEINDTVSLMQRLKPDGEVGAIYSIVTPYIGTELYEICKSMNILPENLTNDSFAHQSIDMYLARNIPKENFEKLVLTTGAVFDKCNKRNKLMLFLRPYILLKLIVARGYYKPRQLYSAIKYICS